MPANNIAELIALAKKDPGKLDFASTGIGTSTHLSGMLFATMAGIKINPVPYKGVAPALTDLIGGQVPLMFCPMAGAVGFVHSGNVRALAVTGSTRSPLFPDLPTVAEAGLPGYEAELHYGIVAPGGTPPAIIAKLNKALNAALGRRRRQKPHGRRRHRAAADHAGGLRGRYRHRGSEVFEDRENVRRQAGVNAGNVSTSFSVIASEAKQSRTAPQLWIASSLCSSQ